MKKISYNAKAKILVADTETESLNLHLARPWQLGFTELEGTKIITEENIFIKWPDLRVSKGAARITGFNYDEYISKAVEPEEAVAKLIPYLENEEYALMGHNWLGFDAFLIRGLLIRTGNWKGWQQFINRVWDTLALGRAWRRNLEVDRENFLAFQFKQMGKPPKGEKKCNLMALAKDLGIEVDESRLHEASYDVFLNYQVGNKLCYKLDI